MCRLLLEWPYVREKNYTEKETASSQQRYACVIGWLVSRLAGLLFETLILAAASVLDRH